MVPPLEWVDHTSSSKNLQYAPMPDCYTQSNLAWTLNGRINSAPKRLKLSKKRLNDSPSDTLPHNRINDSLLKLILALLLTVQKHHGI